ncbi:MAG: glycosyltransferase family 2 protein [Pseudomonadota bacterium]
MVDTFPSAPTVTIGLPVYNGEAYLTEALESLVSQSFADIEFIISDNASTDGTRDICESFTRKDSRIRYDRLDENVGAAGNYNRLLPMAKGRYFKWAAHDDNCDPDFIAACVSALEANMDAVLCYPSTRVIDGEGALITKYRDGLNLPQTTPDARLTAYLRGNFLRERGMCNPIFGLIRTDALRKTHLIQDFLASDRSLLGHLALLGQFIELPEHLFERRVHRGISTMADTRFAARMAWFNTSARPRKKTTFNNHLALRFTHIKDYFRAISTLVETENDRRACRSRLAMLLLSDPRWLAKDIRFSLGFQPSSAQIMRKLEALNETQTHHS